MESLPPSFCNVTHLYSEIALLKTKTNELECPLKDLLRTHRVIPPIMKTLAIVINKEITVGTRILAMV